MSSEWKERKRPNRLEKQYQFEDYEALRDFLDRAAMLRVVPFLLRLEDLVQ